MDCIHLAHIVGSCENSNELSGSKDEGIFHYHLSDQQFPKSDSAPQGDLLDWLVYKAGGRIYVSHILIIQSGD
jgi:hypothetical protein